MGQKKGLKCEKKTKNKNMFPDFPWKMTLERRLRDSIPYYMKFSRHVYFAILMCAYFATLKFRDFSKNLYFESL